MKLRIHEKDEAGFTMVEMLVVVGIIGLLALIAVPIYLSQRKGAWNTAVQQDVSNAAIRLAQTKDFSGALPDTKLSSGVEIKVIPGTSLLVGKGTNNACVEGWFKQSPTDTIWSFNLKERELKKGACQLG